MSEFVKNYHADALESFRNYKKLAERTEKQISMAKTNRLDAPVEFSESDKRKKRA